MRHNSLPKAFAPLQSFQALQALLPLASCLQRYNKEAIIAHHWLDRILPDAALILASSLFPMALRYSASASMRSATAAWLALSSRWIFAVAPLPADAQQRRPGQSAAPPQRPYQQLRLRASAGQQQTSSGGEKYSGLASKLAHLGRIC